MTPLQLPLRFGGFIQVPEHVDIGPGTESRRFGGTHHKGPGGLPLDCRHRPVQLLQDGLGEGVDTGLLAVE